MNRATGKNSAVAIKRVSSQAELVQVFTIRIRVFVQEQRVPAEVELDSDDQQAIHFLAIKSAKAVGTARLVIHRGSAKIGRMAVLKSYRRKGVGAALLMRAILAAKRLHARRIYLHAQVTVIEFYQRMGFRAVGKVFDEAGIAHRKMILGREVTTKGLAQRSRNQRREERSPQRAQGSQSRGAIHRALGPKTGINSPQRAQRTQKGIGLVGYFPRFGLYGTVRSSLKKSCGGRNGTDCN